MLWLMFDPSPAPVEVAAPAASQRRRAGGHGLAAAGLLGAGAVLAFAAARTWRAAGLGLHDLPTDERWFVAAVSALGFAVGSTMPGRGRSAFELGIALWVAVLLATSLAAFGGPECAVYWACGAVSVGLPAAAAAAVLGAVATARGGSAALACGAAALGGALALLLAEWTAIDWSTTAAAGAAVLLAAAAAAPGRAATPPRRTLRAAPMLALPVGGAAAWAFGLCDGVGPAPSAWPVAGVASVLGGAALGFALGHRMRPGHASRVHGLATAGFAVLAAASGFAGELRTGAIGVAAAVLLRSALGNASPREVVHALVRLGVGAALVAIAVAAGVSAAIATAVLAVAASLTLVRATAIGGFSTVVGGFAVVVLGGVQSTATAPGEVELGSHGCARATWSPRTQQLALEVDGAVVDRAGPGREHAAVLALLAAVFAESAGPVVVLGPETGRFAEAARAAGIAELVGAGSCRDADALVPRFANDGPVTRPDEGAAPAWPDTIGSRELLLAIPRGGVRAVVDAALLGPTTAARATVEEHIAMRRAVGTGPVLQAFALDATSPRLVEHCLRAAAAVHPFAGLLVFGDTAVVLGLGTAPDWNRAAARLLATSPAARWRFHAAGVGSIEDVRDALLGRLSGGGCTPTDADLARAGVDESAPTRSDVVRAIEGVFGDRAGELARLRLDAWSGDSAREQRAHEDLRRHVMARPESVLLRSELLTLHVRNADRAIAALDPEDDAAVHEVSVLAARFFHVGSPSPSLQAALALPDSRGQRVREPRAAARAALALDAGFGDDAPRALRAVLAGLPAHTPLADVGRLPVGDRLAELAIGDGPFAIALRRRFASRCAEALVGVFAEAEPPLAAQSALRELADPFVLETALAAARARGAEAEVVRLWRNDLPACAAIRSIASGSSAARQAVLIAAAGRTDPSVLELVARALDDEDEQVRTQAAAALFRSLGERIVYDPAWPAERRRAAARELLDFAQRNPR